MIPHLNLWQDHSRAAHGKNLDTPPLIGCCLGTKVPYSELAEITQVHKSSVPYKEPSF